MHVDRNTWEDCRLCLNFSITSITTAISIDDKGRRQLEGLWLPGLLLFRVVDVDGRSHDLVLCDCLLSALHFIATGRIEVFDIG